MVGSGCDTSQKIRAYTAHFFIWLSCSSDQNSPNLSHDQLLRHFDVPSIKSRFLQHDLMFIHNVFHGRIDSSQLLSNFSLSAPARRTRSPVLWHVPFARVSTIKNGLFCRVPQECNRLLHSCEHLDLDFFCSPAAMYRASARLHAAQAGVF